MNWNSLKHSLRALIIFVSYPMFAVANEANVVIKWNSAVLDAISSTSPGPTIASRALNITSTCAYDAWAAYDAKARATQTGHSLRQPEAKRTLANKNKAVSYAYYQAALDLFPSQKARFDELMQSLGYDPREASSSINSPIGVAKAACGAVLNFRHHDGANQLGDLNPGAYSDYTGYQPVNDPNHIVDPNRWQPLSTTDFNGSTRVQKFLTPHWGKVKPFALKSISQYKIKAPARADSDEYVEQVKQVVSYSAHLTDLQKVIAEYWADGPNSVLPPGHWNVFAQYISERDSHTLDQDIKLFFTLNNAIFDAGIWSWGMKRKYDYVRPITAVHHVYNNTMIKAWAGPGLGTQWISGTDWKPYQPLTFITPPFAEYVSGHSTFSAAGAAVLREFTNSDVFGMSKVIAADSSAVERGVPAQALTLSWATFSDAANEAGISRLYGGIHFRDGDLQAREVGKQIGEAAFKLSSKLFDGKNQNSENSNTP